MSAPAGLAGRGRLRRTLLGLAFIGVNLALVVAAVAAYLDVFDSSVPVTLRADRVGNLLQAGSDVKVRGVIVGRVARVRPTATGADVLLALDPDRVAMVPDNVSARLTPKTLFGERFVDLVPPREPSGRRLGAGTVIPQDRSELAIEVERVLDDLLPLLTAVPPEKLSATLGAVDTALRGRGEQLGTTLVGLQDYLSRLNPELPDLRANLAALARASAALDRAAPDLAGALAAASTTSRTIAERRVDLERFFGSLTSTADDLRRYLVANRDDLIELAATSRPTLELLATYSPAVDCFLRQMAGLVPLMRQAFGEGQARPALHITLEVAPERGKYVPGRDEPQLTDRRGPQCLQPVAPPGKFPQEPGAPDPGAGPGASGFALGTANSPVEAGFVGAVMAGSLGLAPGQVPQWAALLLGPLLRGAQVVLQ